MVQFQNSSISGEPREYLIAVDSWRMDSAGEFILRLTCDIAVPNDDNWVTARHKGNSYYWRDE